MRLKLHRLFYIHTLGRIVSGSIEIAEGLYIGGDIEEILSYIRRGNTVEGHIKFFLGYSGWEAGQFRRRDCEYLLDRIRKSIAFILYLR